MRSARTSEQLTLMGWALRLCTREAESEKGDPPRLNEAASLSLPPPCLMPRGRGDRDQDPCSSSEAQGRRSGVLPSVGVKRGLFRVEVAAS